MRISDWSSDVCSSDLQMIRVAAGEKLSFAQKDVKIDGWAIETRVYAEDPYREFLPSTGRLVRYEPPVATDQHEQNSEERRGGEECVSKWRYRGSSDA